MVAVGLAGAVVEVVVVVVEVVVVVVVVVVVITTIPLLHTIRDPLRGLERLHGFQAHSPLRVRVVEHHNKDGSRGFGLALLLGLLAAILLEEAARHERSSLKGNLGLEEVVEPVLHFLGFHEARRVHQVRDMKVPALVEHRDDRRMI